MKILNFFFAIAIVLFSPVAALAQGTTAFVYQGQLRDGGTNANGNYTMILKLYDAASGGNQISNTITTSATLLNGIFSVNADFGANAFDGNMRWLDITVTNATATETLSPRVQLLPTPYSLFAANANSLNSGTWSLHTGNFQNNTNVFQIFDNGVFVMGMSTNGCLFGGNVEANQVHAGSLSADISVTVDDGGSIFLSDSNNDNGVQLSSDGGNGLNIRGPITVKNFLQFNDGSGLMPDGQGGLQTSGNFSVSNLVFHGNTIQFPVQSGAQIFVQTNGDFIFDNNIRLSSLGVLKLPTPDSGTISLTGFGFGGGHLLGVDATLQSEGINLANSDNTAYVLISYAGGGVVSIGGSLSLLGDVHCTGVTATGNISANSFSTTSDRNVKENFAPVNSREILDRVASLPISRWNFKTERTPHIGPMAQDFYQTFNVGMDDKHIATVDEEGVALAAIQGLNDKLKEKDAQIESLEKRLADLEKLVNENKQAGK